MKIEKSKPQNPAFRMGHPHSARVGGVALQNVCQLLFGPVRQTQTQAAQTDQEMAVQPVAGGEVLFKQLKLRERNGEVVDTHGVEQMSLAVIHKLMEALQRFAAAVEEMLSICSHAECGGSVQPLTEELRRSILKDVDEMNDKGFRVLAIAQKSSPAPAGSFGVEDERDMVLMGYLAFLDPPKESTAAALRALKEHGVTAKILTGDHEKVTRTICRQVGLKVRNMLLGSDVARMSGAELAWAAQSTEVFAKLTPDQKARAVTALRASGHTVGFMGDGINDAAAMKAADIGISVDTAVDVAKESADVILLEKDLMVLEQGIIEGRKTYTNMIKYIKMTASSNFGNMFSVLAASALLPFLPMMSVQRIVIAMNAVFWGMKPAAPRPEQKETV